MCMYPPIKCVKGVDLVMESRPLLLLQPFDGRYSTGYPDLSLDLVIASH